MLSVAVGPVLCEGKRQLIEHAWVETHLLEVDPGCSSSSDPFLIFPLHSELAASSGTRDPHRGKDLEVLRLTHIERRWARNRLAFRRSQAIGTQ